MSNLIEGFNKWQKQDIERLRAERKLFDKRNSIALWLSFIIIIGGMVGWIISGIEYTN